jgi:hypothetical protein
MKNKLMVSLVLSIILIPDLKNVYFNSIICVHSGSDNIIEVGSKKLQYVTRTMNGYLNPLFNHLVIIKIISLNFKT